MAIDDAGDYELARGVEYLRVFRCLDGRPDFRDFAILNKDRAVLDGAVRNGEDRGVLDQDHRRRIRRIGGECQKWKREEAQQANHCGARMLFNRHGWNPHCAPPATDESLLVRPSMAEPLVVAACEAGLVPVTSIEKPITSILPFSVLPSNVPVKTTSVGFPSIGMLMVKLK